MPSRRLGLQEERLQGRVYGAAGGVGTFGWRYLAGSDSVWKEGEPEHVAFRGFPL